MKSARKINAAKLSVQFDIELMKLLRSDLKAARAKNLNCN